MKYPEDRTAAIPSMKESETALLNGEEFSSGLLKNSPTPIVVINPDTSVRYVNPAMERLAGFSCAELVGRKPPYPWWPDEGIGEGTQLLEEGMRHGIPRRERLFKDKAGRKFWIEIMSTPVLEDGKLKYYLATWIDISERKRAEEALRESEEFSSSLLNGSPNPIVVVEPDTAIKFVNPAFEKMTGLSLAEITGRKAPYPFWFEANSAENIQVLMEGLHKGARRLERHFKNKDGKQLWVEVTSGPVMDNGKLKYYLATWVDITERRLAEEALRESEERYRQLVELSPDAAYIRYEDIIVFINPAGARLLGAATPQDIVGKSAIDFIHPDYYNVGRERVRQVEEMGKQVPFLEEKFIRLDGTVIDVEVAGSPITYKNRPATQVIVRDITERKRAEQALRESEEHYRSLFEQSRDAIYISTREGTFLDVNPSMLELFGYTKREMVGMDVRNLYVYPAERERFRAEIERKGSVRDYEVKFRKKDGTQMDCVLTTTLRRGADKSILGYQGIIRDITEYRQAEIQLIQSAKMASLGLMAGGIAHEVRNPLSIISASAQLLVQYADNPELRMACVQKIHSATRRASSIIESLLEFARPTGEVMQEIDLHVIMDETLNLLGQQLLSNRVMLRRQLQQNLPRIYGNSNLLQQVFVNLILNACHAMPEGGILTLTTRADSQQVELQFSDTGVGIPLEHLSRVFDPFFTTMPPGRGTGLGLSLCYSIIQRHRGTIEVASQVGEGTTVTIHLPVSQTNGQSGSSEPGKE